MEKSIVWKGLRYDTEEHCGINYHGDHIMVHSEIEGWVNLKPVYAEYWIKLDTSWNVIEFEISTHIADAEYKYALKRDENGVWRDKFGTHPEYNNCSYIDISLTPFTNTLPINGLKLAEGQSKAIEVVYIDIMKHEIRRDEQHYKRTGSLKYRFENDGSGFIADIDADENGFITHYPELFDMIRIIH